MNEKKPHILLIPAWYAPVNESHLGSFVRDQALELARAGYKTGVLHVSPKAEKEQTIENTSGSFTEIIASTKKTRFKLWNQLSIFFKYKKLFKDYCARFGAPEILHSHSLAAIPYAYNLARKFHIPLIHTEHIGALMLSNIPLSNSKLKWLKSPEVVIGVSPALCDAIGKYTTQSPVFIPNMVYRAFFESTLVQPIPQPMETFRLICVSDLDKNKGQHELLAALKILSGQLNCHLTLVGDGPERSQLESFVVNNHLTTQVSFSGKQNRANIIKLLLNSHCYCTATRFESFGLHIAEALAVGLPVIASGEYGPAIYLNDQNSLPISPSDPESIAAAILKMEQKLNEFSPLQIRKSISQISHPDQVIPQITTLYNQISKGK